MPQDNQTTEEAIVQQQIDSNARVDQFGVANTPFHVHNGSDSNKISFSNLTDRVFLAQAILPGTAPATSGNYTIFFVAPFQVRFSGATCVFVTQGTDGSAVTLQIEKLTGTTAPGSGTSLLMTAFNLKGANNTTQYGTLASIQKTSFTLKKGDRLALKLSGTPTSVASLVVEAALTY